MSNFGIGKAYFVLDVETFEVYVFKQLDQQKPTQTFNIRGGTFPNDISK